jgi:hypothetical protein
VKFCLHAYLGDRLSSNRCYRDSIKIGKCINSFLLQHELLLPVVICSFVKSKCSSKFVIVGIYL